MSSFEAIKLLSIAHGFLSYEYPKDDPRLKSLRRLIVDIRKDILGTFVFPIFDKVKCEVCGFEEPDKGARKCRRCGSELLEFTTSLEMYKEKHHDITHYRHQVRAFDEIVYNARVQGVRASRSQIQEWLDSSMGRRPAETGNERQGPPT